MRKPWYRKDRKCWYLETDSGRINLGSKKKQAYEQWHKIVEIESRREAGDQPFADLYFAYFTAATKQVKAGQLAKATLATYCYYLDLFSESCGDMLVSELQPYHVSEWLAEFPDWGSSSCRAAIKSIKLVINWGVGEGLVPRNPIEKVRKPSSQRRTALVSREDHQRMVEATRSGGGASKSDKQFGLVLVALRHCGGRPQDVSRVRVEDVDEDVSAWTIDEHKRKRTTGQPRVVYLSPCLATVTRILSTGRDSGPLFRGRRGCLTVNAIGQRIKRLKSQLGLDADLIAYSYRHTYITDSITRGVDVVTVAELAGTSVEMIQRHYGHLYRRKEHMREAAAKAMRSVDQ